MATTATCPNCRAQLNATSLNSAVNGCLVFDEDDNARDVEPRTSGQSSRSANSWTSSPRVLADQQVIAYRLTGIPALFSSGRHWMAREASAPVPSQVHLAHPELSRVLTRDAAPALRRPVDPALHVPQTSDTHFVDKRYLLSASRKTLGTSQPHWVEQQYQRATSQRTPSPGSERRRV